jgi:hypothetical protein
LVFGSWSDYLAVRLTPPDPEQVRDEQWFEYLHKLDEDSRQRRRRSVILNLAGIPGSCQNGRWEECEMNLTAPEKSAEGNGWNEPAMDDYDHYDERFAKRCQSVAET